MTLPLAALPAVLLAASSGSSKTSSSSGSSVTFIIFLVLIGVVGYFFLLRPQQQKAKRQRAAQSDIGVGDEVLTVGGIVGTVLDIDSERVTIVTGVDPGSGGGPGAQPMRLVLVRNAISRKVEPTAAADAQPAGRDGASGAGTGGAADGTHPGYGGVPDADDDRGEAMQGGEAEDHEGTDGGPREGGEP